MDRIRAGEGQVAQGGAAARGASPPSRSSRRARAVEAAAAVLCRRWKPGILWLLASGCRRYSELAARLPGVSPKVLAQQLRELERDGLVTRHVAAQGRNRVEYALTPVGDALRPLLEELERWGQEYQRTRGHGQPPARPIAAGRLELSR